jgi:hypothetical protein
MKYALGLREGSLPIKTSPQKQIIDLAQIRLQKSLFSVNDNVFRKAHIILGSKFSTI